MSDTHNCIMATILKKKRILMTVMLEPEEHELIVAIAERHGTLTNKARITASAVTQGLGTIAKTYLPDSPLTEKFLKRHTVATP